MPITFTRYANGTISAAREARITGVDLDCVDFSKPRDVLKLRAAITHMGAWDRFVDRTFHHGSKGDALECLADVVLCDQVAIWQRDGIGREPVEELRNLDRQRLQTKLLDMLTADGRQAVLAKHQQTQDGIRFSPDTGTGLDTLLGITFSLDHGNRLLARGNPAEAWAVERRYDVAAQAGKQDAMALRRNGSYGRAAQAWEQAARDWVAAGKGLEAAEAYEQAANDHRSDRQRLTAAEALGKASELWAHNSRHDRAAASRRQQASCFEALGLGDEAAKCTREHAEQRAQAKQRALCQGLPTEILGKIVGHLEDHASAQALRLVSHTFHDIVAAQEQSSLHASGNVRDLEFVLQHIDELPISFRLAALFKAEWPSGEKGAEDALSQDRIFSSLIDAGEHLAPRDRRLLLTKVAQKSPSWRHWLACWNAIEALNHSEPRGESQALSNLAMAARGKFSLNQHLDEELLRGFESALLRLKDSDPYKETAMINYLESAIRNNRLDLFQESRGYLTARGFPQQLVFRALHRIRNSSW